MAITFEEWEARIRESLAAAQFQIEQINDVFGYFPRLLNVILAGGDKRDPKRYWAVDDLYCNEARREAGKFLTSGIVYWITGGQQYEFFHAVIEPTDHAINYVFTFSQKAPASLPDLVIGRDENGISLGQIPC